jgi:hypothetical protein
MLAAALDQVVCAVEGVEVEGEEFNPSCELLAMWLGLRLDVPVRRSLSAGPGLTAVRLDTTCGPIVLDRPDGALAMLSIMGQPDRAVALKRRDTAELIAEELRRLDPDDTYASALRFGVERLHPAGGRIPAQDPAAPDSVPDPAAWAAAWSDGPDDAHDAHDAHDAGNADAKGAVPEAAAEGSAPQTAAETPVTGTESQ